ncbi:MAG: transketolase [Proteobacteria bacterium]|nr:transketolase [Pseudomonadota bacterium]
MNDRQVLANAIRALAMDAVERAQSGHPGMPMGMAEIAEVLWRHHLSHNPKNPSWINRDRFVISNGHGSMLLYALLHLSGYDLSIEEIKRFRQLGSRTPGHPEYGYTVGVETTTGPLGQGLSNAVGMALAEKVMGAEFNEKNFDVINHHTYAFLGDGCLMEGLSHEVSSLAGVLGLGKLIALYDDNGISIDSDKGNIKNWFDDDTPKRYEAYGWQVIRDIDGHSFTEIDRAIKEAKENSHQPTLICCKTIIGKGSPNKQGTGGVHGAPLGLDEIKLAKKQIGWEYKEFEIPEHIYREWDCSEHGEKREQIWQEKFASYSQAHPVKSAELKRRVNRELPYEWDSFKQNLQNAILKNPKNIATRKASQEIIDHLMEVTPELLGGSADLAASNLTMHKSAIPVTKRNGRGDYVFYGVREFGMAGIMNGLALYSGLIPFGGTFLVFSDYARNALRMSALMKLRTIHVFTHDSIGLGEDGPTHQPIEHASSLRAIPNMMVWRPCDGYETCVAWLSAIENKKGPTSILLSRQSLPAQFENIFEFKEAFKGGYVLVDSENPAAIIVATGSEVSIAVNAQQTLSDKGISVRVVSMPSTTTFDRQDWNYKNKVLPKTVPKVAIEAGVTDFWRKYVGLEGDIIGLDEYGESGPGKDLFTHFGLTVDELVRRVEKII